MHRRHALLCLVLTLVACARPLPPMAVRSDLLSTTNAATSTAPPPAAASARTPLQPAPVRGIVGVWEDRETPNLVRFTIDLVGGVPTVVSAAGSVGDFEQFEIESSHFDGHYVTWVYRVPSTGYVVTMSSTDEKPNRLGIQWSNSAGDSGTQFLFRVSP